MKFYFLSFTLLFINFALAQVEIETDRPDQTDTPAIVSAGRFQVEGGLQHEQQSDDGREQLLPTILWKYGVNERFEVRLVTELASFTDGDTSITGFKPIVVGIKFNLLEEKGILPKTSVSMQFGLPKIASKDFQEDNLSTEIRLLFQNSITEDVKLGYNAGAEWGDAGEPEYKYTFSPSISFGKVTVFTESFGFMYPHEQPEHWVDGGLLFLLTDNLQIDVAGGYELTAHNDFHGYFGTVGISCRL